MYSYDTQLSLGATIETLTGHRGGGVVRSRWGGGPAGGSFGGSLSVLESCEGKDRSHVLGQSHLNREVHDYNQARGLFVKTKLLKPQS